MAPPINVQDWYGDRHTCQIASGALEYNILVHTTNMAHICFLTPQGSPPLMLACQFFQNSIDRSVMGSFDMGGKTFKCSTSYYVCSYVSKFRYPWNNMTVGCFNAPALNLYWICTEKSVLKIMDAGYCFYVHIFMKNIKSLKTLNFYLATA